MVEHSACPQSRIVTPGLVHQPFSLLGTVEVQRREVAGVDAPLTDQLHLGADKDHLAG
jgi:hypothetical protein